MSLETRKPTIAIEKASEALKPSDLHDLCDATIDAIESGGGFGWVTPPQLETLERYWSGTIAIPDRQVFIGRLDGVVCGAAQLVRPPRTNEAQAHTHWLVGNFVAPWARGHGVARGITDTAIAAAREAGAKLLMLDVRATQTVAIHIYESRGFVRWATHPFYALVDGQPVAGHYYMKILDETALNPALLLGLDPLSLTRPAL